jgi:hypothetical protein
MTNVTTFFGGLLYSGKGNYRAQLLVIAKVFEPRASSKMRCASSGCWI